MTLSLTFGFDAFERPTALRTLHDLVRWLSLRQNWEESLEMSDCDSIARHWGVFSHQDKIYVEVTTGLDGQHVLKHFPGLSTLPVIPGEQVGLLGGDPCRGQTYYFGPFSEEHENL